MFLKDARNLHKAGGEKNRCRVGAVQRRRLFSGEWYGELVFKSRLEMERGYFG